MKRKYCAIETCTEEMPSKLVYKYQSNEFLQVNQKYHDCIRKIKTLKMQ